MSVVEILDDELKLQGKGLSKLWSIEEQNEATKVLVTGLVNYINSVKVKNFAEYLLRA